MIREELENAMSEETEEGTVQTAREVLTKAWQDLQDRKLERDDARSDYATDSMDVIVLHNYLAAEEMVTAAENTFKKLKAELEKMKSGK